MRAISSLLLFYPFLITTFFSFFKQARKNEGACRSYVKKTCFQTFCVIYKKTPIMDLQENTCNGDFLKQSCRPASFKFVKKKTPRLCKIYKYNFLQNITVRLVLWVGYADCVSVFFSFGTEMILFWLFCPILRVLWYISRGFHSSATLYF